MLNSVGPAMCCNGGQVVVELDPTGSNLLFSTSIGPCEDPMETGGLAVNSAGVIYTPGNNLGMHLPHTAGRIPDHQPLPNLLLSRLRGRRSCPRPRAANHRDRSRRRGLQCRLVRDVAAL